VVLVCGLRRKEGNRVQRRFSFVAVVAVAWAMSGIAPARAQVLPTPPDTSGARVTLGWLRLNPSISLSDLGVDTNVFNEADVEHPERDVAMTLVPQTDLWVRMGRTWLTGNLRQDLIWFRDYRDESAANGSYHAGWFAPFNRLAVLVDGHWVRAKERPTYEIDSRALRREAALAGTAEVRAFSRTFLGGYAERRGVRFSQGSFFEQVDLQDQLDRTRTSTGVVVRHELTPLTSLVAEVTGFTDRFMYSRDRDADSAQAGGGVRFDPAALVKGSVFVGYRRFTPKSPDIPAYTGATLTANVSYDAWSSSHVTVEGMRDVDYSFEDAQPYYLLNGVTGTLTQRLFGPVDVQGSAGLRSLDYRNRANVPGLPLDRRDHVRILGAGLGYHLGRDLRFAIDTEHHRRTSAVAGRSFSGARYGVTITYGM